ncbi:MAG: ribokinase [Caulobacteraceae bacterium]
MSVCVLGSINLDIVCRVEALPAAGETVAALSLERFPGGKGANQAVAAARWGAATRLIGAVGDDEEGRFLIARLEEAGVDVSAIARLQGEATGRAHITVGEAGENAIVVVGGANLRLDREPVVGALEDGCQVLLAQFETPRAVVEAAFTWTGGAKRLLNAAPALAQGVSLFPLADILVVNEIELARYAGLAQPPSPGSALEEAARSLISRPEQSVVVTLGAEGAACVDATGAMLVPGRPARAVDATGAGDCFCGVLAAALAQGAGLSDALFTANAAAAVSTERSGAQAWAGFRADVEKVSPSRPT